MAEINDNGNTILRDFNPIDRYYFDFNVCTAKKGWSQYDTYQDAHYFGVWVNKEKLQIITYAEGDIITTICNNKETFNAEILTMDKFYEKTASFTTIDFGKNLTTKYYQDRNEFLIS